MKLTVWRSESLLSSIVPYLGIMYPTGTGVHVLAVWVYDGHAFLIAMRVLILFAIATIKVVSVGLSILIVIVLLQALLKDASMISCRSTQSSNTSH